MTLNHQITITLKWDAAQFELIRTWFGARPDSAKLQQVTQELKTSAENLTNVVAKNQPKK